MLVKQVPTFAELTLGPSGRLMRDGATSEMSAYCRRAVSKAVELAARDTDSSVVVFTLGPPVAEDVLREAVAWGRDRRVDIQGVLLSDHAFAGSDTIATARLLAAAINRDGPFDLVLAGKNSLDADTGQVPPQLAEFLGLPFIAGAKTLTLDEGLLTVGCEHDDGWVDCEVQLPAVLSCAERLCDPAKVPPKGRAAVPDQAIRHMDAGDLGPGPWGAADSLTAVGEIRRLSVARSREIDADAPVVVQVQKAVRALRDRGALGDGSASRPPALGATGGPGPVVAVLAETNNDALTQELCGAAAQLGDSLSGSTVLFSSDELSPAAAGSWGADRLLRFEPTAVEEDIAVAVADWARRAQPWAILFGSTAFGREIASRVAVAVGAGLTGDAIDLEVADGRLVAWKPAFGGVFVAAITATSPLQLATVRAGVMPRPQPRDLTAEIESVPVGHRGRVTVHVRHRNDSLERLGEARVVIGVGAGVAPEELPRLAALQELLHAEIGCTRKVTDQGWLPHSSQIGITGRSITPRLYIAVGTSGKFNHMAGVRSAGTVLAINPDRTAPVWDHADVGIVADWRACIDLLEAELRRGRAHCQPARAEPLAENPSLRR